ncbi:hypothetical protein [Photobacterium alginatilyticum]|uniref:Lipoprotein n=1 Tax=Photobacterium alginatilyticum TaxID=1775171 RepID=A0ABW9YDR3_9GAMM|nr:hypothetical protein [Photobacterium alginatilyticum]NBI51909.1 hypothetical protein [Photobacterium alginatilyticum]
MKKIGLLAASVALALTGCGGSDSHSGNANTAPGAATEAVIKAIDGYLVDAEVYIDRNKDGVADSGEKLTSLTNEKGEVTISAADTQFPVIVRAIAGKTYDTDKGGRLTQTVEMTAAAGSNVVTPFTTLAAIENLSLPELAAKLNLSEEVISGDYVASKADTGVAQEAKKAHAVARSLTLELGSTISESQGESDKLITKSNDIITVLDTAINNGDELDDVLISFDDSGSASQIPMPPTVKEHFTGKTFYSVSTNGSYFKDEGMVTATFTDTEVHDLDDSGKVIEEWPITYTTNGFKGGDGLDEVIYMSDAFTMVVTSDNDMIFYTVTNIDNGFTAQAATETMFKGKTLYHLWDDSTNKKARPTFVTLKFDATDNVVDVIEDGETRQQDWSISDNGQMIIQGVMEGDDWVIQPTNLGNDDFTVFYEGTYNESIPYFFTANKDLALSLYDEWYSLAQ